MILIIAYGNPLREDDGAGLVLAEKLETLLRRLAIETRRVEMQQLLPELAAEIAADQPDAVLFVDTRVATGDEEQVVVQPLQANNAASPGLGHHLDPAAVLTYATALYGRAKQPAWLVTVPGWQFGYREHLSTYSEEAIFHALNVPESQLYRLVDKLQQLHPTRHTVVP